MSANILTESTSQKLYEYYVDVSAAQLKAYSLVQLSYMFLTVYNQSKSFLSEEHCATSLHCTVHDLREIRSSEVNFLLSIFASQLLFCQILT